jgi:hypothetical protein
MSRSPHYGYALFGGDHSAKPRGQTKAPLHLGVEAGKGMSMPVQISPDVPK